MKKRFIRSDRRSFLKGAVVAGGAAVVAPSTASATSLPEVEGDIKGPGKVDKGYEENDYIRNYYERARF